MSIREQKCIASNELSDFTQELNHYLSAGWQMVQGTMVGFGMSHQTSPKAKMQVDATLLRYTQANFLCVIERPHGMFVGNVIQDTTDGESSSSSDMPPHLLLEK